MRDGVTFVTTSLSHAGAQTQLVRVATRLRERGWRVSVISLMAPQAFLEELCAAGIPVASLDMRRGMPEPGALVRAVRLLREWRPQVLACFMFHANVLGRLAGRLAGVPVIVTSIRNEKFGGRVRERIERGTAWLGDAVTTNSRVVATSLVARGVVAAQRLRVVANALPAEAFAPTDEAVRASVRAALGVAPDDFVWLAAGRLEEQKDFPTLVAAARRLLDEQPAARVLVAGEGPLQPALERQAAYLGIGDRVRFLGFRKDMRALLDACDAFVLSSLTEGLPNVVLEAVAAGRPAVATDVGGVRELVEDGVNGYVVPPADAAALAAAMARLGALPAPQRRRMAATGRSRLESRHALDRVVDEWESLFRELMAKKGAGDPPGAPTRLMHVTTVPMSLHFLVGQPTWMAGRGIATWVTSSPGEMLDRFAADEPVAGTMAIEMPRRITPFADLRAVLAIARHLRRVRPHIVHAHTPKGGLLGVLGAWLARVPVRIYHMHGSPLFTATGGRRRLLRACERLTCRLATQVLCVGASLRDAAVAEGVCAPERIRVPGAGSINGVDADGRFAPARTVEAGRATRARFGIPEEAVVVGYIGRLVRDKGIVELAAAWRALRDRYPTLHLLVVGDFEPQDPVPAEVAAVLREDARVHLAGFDWDTPPLFAAMDVVALPTYREGLPVVPLEAAAMGLPVVATRVTGCVDVVVDGVTGTLVPPRDAQLLADAIAEYVCDPMLCHVHGSAARARVRAEFRPEVVWDALHGEYVRLLEAHGLPRPRPGVATSVRLGAARPEHARA